ncbi:MAG: N-acetylmuramoyl-L-alanine amidase [Bacteroidaceae bacterium]|nr:N-acetylmuramoyl-L-alanine amidase [Bacteroidaceae bacterium]
MRTIKYIAVHCTAGSQKATVRDLEMEFKRKGWKNPGYHYVVTADGKIHQMLATELVSNGVKGFNSVTVNVAYTGGIDAKGKGVDNRTDAQKESLKKLLKLLKGKFPDAVIQGHRDFSPDKNGNGVVDPWERIKDCPCFNAKTEYKNI